jgi:catechol 2,3-dioxygenase-like lactoylglutathione lyase family enzyme
VRVLGHLGINVPDLDIARSYYGAVMPLFDFELFFDAADEFAYMPAGGKRGTFLFFYPASDSAPYSRREVGLQHLAFAVPTRQRVQEAHRTALSLGSQEVHAPQDWPQYPPPYFAAFWLDPLGFMLEAVCHHDR